MRTNLLIAVSLLAIGCGGGGGGEEPPAGLSRRGRPNILVVCVDDLGYGDLGAYGNAYHETDALDALVAEGVRFTQAYADAPVGAPSRIALHTGRSSARIGCYEVVAGRYLEGYDPDEVDFVPPENDLSLPEGSKLVSEYLDEIGYRTGFVGKWHMAGVVPPEVYDDFVVVRLPLIEGAHLDATRAPIVKSRGFPAPRGALGEYLIDCSVRFVERAGTQPFFLFLGHTLVHEPLEAPRDLVARYEREWDDGERRDPTYAAMVEELDRGIGRLVDTLRRRGQFEETLIFLTSDNGGATGPVFEEPGADGVRRGTRASNHPLRGGKGELWEGGIRVPMSVVYGGHLRAGATVDAPVGHKDVLPTILDVTGHPTFERDREELDGRSLRAELTRGPGAAGAPPERAFHWHFPGYRGLRDEPPDGMRPGMLQRPASAIRRGRWKLIESLETGELRLFDLDLDPAEQHDVSRVRPELAAELQAELSDWRAEVRAALPEPKEPRGGG